MRIPFIALGACVLLAVIGLAQSDRITRDFDLLGDSRALYTDVAHSFGLQVVFDADYELIGTKIHFRMQDADYREAFHALEAATGSFVVPLNSKTILVSKESTQKRAQLEPFVAMTVEIPQSTTAQETTEVIHAVQQVMALDKVGIDTQLNSVVIRGPISKVMPARQLLEDLLQYHPEVNIELDLVEITESDLLTYGFNLQNSFSLNNFKTASGLANTFAELGRGALSSAAFGIGIANSTLIAQMSKNVGRTMFHMDLRSADQQPATFHVGNRYPLITTQYVGGTTSSTGTVNNNGTNGLNGATGTTGLSNSTPSTFGTVANPSGVVLGDFNEDSLLDVASTAAGADSVAILLGKGKGTFGDSTLYPTGKNPSALIAVDLDSDGHLDIVTTDAGAGTISVLLGKGDGTFQDATHITVGANPAAIVSGDFNADGKPDLAVANADSNSIWILLGRGDGTFQNPINLAAGTSPRSLVVADLNGDGVLDLAAVNYSSNDLWIYLGNGNGTFRNSATYSTGTQPRGVTAATFLPGGTVDLAVANSGSNTVSIFIGSGNGTFSDGGQFLTGNGPVSIVSKDFNSDGLLDVAVTNVTDGTISLLLGLGNGSFQTALQFTVGLQPRSMATGDLNLDGYADLVVGNFQSNDFSILLGAGNGAFVDSNGNSYNASGGQSYSPPPSFTYEDLGLVVKITPHTNGTEEMSLDIDAAFKVLAGQATNGMPIIANRSVKSGVRVRNGEWAIVAGLLTGSEARTMSGIPGISLVPALGPLTSTKTRNRSQTQVLLLIKTHYLGGPNNEKITRPVRVGSDTRPPTPL